MRQRTRDSKLQVCGDAVPLENLSVAIARHGLVENDGSIVLEQDDVEVGIALLQRHTHVRSVIVRGDSRRISAYHRPRVCTPGHVKRRWMEVLNGSIEALHVCAHAHARGRLREHTQPSRLVR